MISELTEHARSSSSSEDFMCAKYLSSLNDIFERTLLGKKTRIFNIDGYGMQRMEDGFAFFEAWCKHLKQGGEFSNGAVESKVFLSWQVSCLSSMLKKFLIIHCE